VCIITVDRNVSLVFIFFRGGRGEDRTLERSAETKRRLCGNGRAALIVRRRRRRRCRRRSRRRHPMRSGRSVWQTHGIHCHGIVQSAAADAFAKRTCRFNERDVTILNVSRVDRSVDIYIYMCI